MQCGSKSAVVRRLEFAVDELEVVGEIGPPRFLEGKKLKHPNVPSVPTRRSLYSAPIACAASSIERREARISLGLA
jgi:hypothetical protein